jgi:YesN/AraC family two-component response regulator
VEKILVIDDEKATLSMFRLILDAYGYSVYTAENGAEGIEIFRKKKPAIVLTDIKMPGIDGLAVLQQIKEIAPQTAVIVITGHGDAALAEQAAKMDAVDFISKPIKKEALDAALEKARAKLGRARPDEGV